MFTLKTTSVMNSITFIALCCVVVVFGSSYAQLDNSFYKNTCPKVHSIVREVVRNVSKKDTRMLASLVRLHFHDCFVQVSSYFYRIYIHHMFILFKYL